MKFKFYPFLKYRGSQLLESIKTREHRANLKAYKSTQHLPWSRGYDEFKWEFIKKTILDPKILSTFLQGGELPKNYGIGLDERVVEYPWTLANIPDDSDLQILDAGSTLNFEPIITHDKISNKKLTIANLNPERYCFWQKGISYTFADIRKLPFQDNFFDIVTCISTLEHIGMNNALYTGTGELKEPGSETFEPALRELMRVLKKDGVMLISLPFGKYQNHGFFQQFNQTMIDKILSIANCRHSVAFFRYKKTGWNSSDSKECGTEEYFNIHAANHDPATTLGNNVDKAAAARAVACIKLYK